jgi:uncharacterized membrane protein
VLVRHYFNTRHDSNKFAWTLPAAALGMICLAYVTSPMRPAPNATPVAAQASQPAAVAAKVEEAAATEATPSDAPQTPAPAKTPASAIGTDFTQVNSVIQERCTVCHSAQPSSPMFSAAPAGLILDTPQQIQQQAAKIQAQAVASQVMPLGNITQMTQDERNLIGAWIAQGAKLD